MTRNRIDSHPARPMGVTDEQMDQAATVLAEVAAAYAKTAPEDLVDEITVVARIGASAYVQAGRSCHGGSAAVSRLAQHLAPVVPTGATAAEYARLLLDAARAAGWSEDDNEPVIPKIPGPRTGEPRRVPAPRRRRPKAVAP